MRLTICLISLIVGCMLPLLPKHAQAQVKIAGPDSLIVSTAGATMDTLQKKSFFWSSLTSLDKPSKAALRSAIIPGLGQAYNRSYWKIPVIYAGGAVIGYFLVTNNTHYQSYNSALIAR